MIRGFVCFGGAVAMLVSMNGAAAEASGPHTLKVARRTAGRAELGLTVSVSADVDGSLLLSATAGDLTFRKAVYPDGRFHAQIEQGRDRVAFAGADGRLTVTYGSRTLTLSSDQDDQQPRRVRELLVSSPALRLFRRLTAELEASGDTTAEVLGIRITGAMIGEVDGDEGAVRRLARELRAKFGGHVQQVRLRASCWDTYQALVNQAAIELEQCVGSFAVYNPMRQVCAMVWTLQVEGAWFSYLSCSAVQVPGK